MRRWLVGFLLACVACSPGTPDGASSPPPTDRQTTTTERATPSGGPTPETSSPAAEGQDRSGTPQPSPSPSFSLPPGMPQVPDFFDDEGNFDFEAFQRWLEEQQKNGAGNGNDGECNPLSPTCLYDPLWGSCEWDAWRGWYVCDGPFHREGYDCYLDLWWDKYICRPPNG